MGEEAENYHEDYECRDPAIELVNVDNFIPDDGDHQSADCDDEDAGPTWHVVVDCMEELSANNRVRR